VTTVLQARSRGFVSTPFIERLTRRALRYLQSGFSVHLRGPAGTGKTTMALHLADLLGRPIMLIFGDDESTTSDLIGNQNGYSRKKVVDNFIHSVVKVEDEMRHNWVDSRLTMACREGFTLVYDEFNRSRPEVNNVLLSALEEKLLVLPPSAKNSEYLRVSPHFRGIFTSNPEEYCGVHATQDALMDRLITIDVPEPDELTQQEIMVQKTGLSREAAYVIVQLVQLFRQGAKVGKSSGLRASLVLSKVCQEHGIPVSARSDDFRDTCVDVLLSRTKLDLGEGMQLLWHCLSRLEALEQQAGVVLAMAQGTRLAAEAAAKSGTGNPATPVERATVVPIAGPIAGGPILDGLLPIAIGEEHPEGAMDPALAAIGQNGSASNGSASNGSTSNGSASNGQSRPGAGLEQEAPLAVATLAQPVEAAAAAEAPEAAALAETPRAAAGSSSSPQLPSFTQKVAQQITNQLVAVGTGDRAFSNDVEQSIYTYLQSSQGQHLSAIESALGISRVQAVDALRSLAEQGWVVVQRDDSASHDAGRTIYRVESTPA